MFKYLPKTKTPTCQFNQNEETLKSKIEKSSGN
jgi:hypothetical protein